MLDKSFEHTVRFYEAATPGGAMWLPLVTVTLVQTSGNRVDLSLMFDTGASQMTLRRDLYPLLGVPSWDAGRRVEAATGGGIVTAYRYEATFEFLGKTITCPVHLLENLPPHPLYQGLFGREQMFEAFGFGFWESAHELYVALNP